MRTPSLLLADTARRDRAVFSSFEACANEAGLRVEHLAIDQLLDLGKDALGRIDHPLVFVVIAPELLSAPSSRAATLVFEAVGRVFERPGPSVTALMLPAFRSARPLAALDPLFSPLLSPLIEALPPAAHLGDLQRFEAAVGRHAIAPLGVTRTWETALLPAPPGASAPSALRDVLGARLGPDARDRWLVIGNARALSFSSVTEDFHFSPLDPAIERDLEAAITRDLGALASGCAGLPPAISIERAREEPRREQAGSRRSAWFALDAYEDPTRTEDQRRLAELVFRAGLDTLWLSVSPNQYYSPIGRFAARREAMERSLGAFGDALLRARPSGRDLPRIVIGVQLMNDFYAPAPQPARTARDLYGNQYPDVPAPLDARFWTEEVIDPAREILSRFRDRSGLAPAGVVLDLEMYLRPITGTTSFSSTMGPGEEAPVPPPGTSWSSLFQDLEDRAEALGRRIRDEIRAVLPGAAIGAYAPAPSLDWFYAGLYRALSKPSDAEPFDLYTFDARWRRHQAHLAARGVRARHHGALLLSKIKSRGDFSRIDAILSEHDGVWINRFSRLIEPVDPSAWHHLEQCPLGPEDRERFCDALAAAGAPRLSALS